MRLPRLIAAAALTAGLVAAAPAAQAVPTAPAHVTKVEVAQATKDKSKLTATVQEQVKYGHDIQVKATLKHESKDGLRPSVHQKLELVYYIDGEQPVVAKGKTDMRGKYTFRLETVKELAGRSFRFRVDFKGTSEAAPAKSPDVRVKVTR